MQSRRKFVYPILCSVFIFAFLSVAWGSEVSKGKFYVVGTGPAGPEHITLKALEIIKMADFIICSKEHSRPFLKYFKGEIIEDVFDWLWRYKEKSFKDLNEEEVEEYLIFRDKKAKALVEKIIEKINQGYDVVLLEGGEPNIFSPCHFITERYGADEVEIVTGMNSLCAANAAIGKSIIPAYDSQFVVLTAPFLISDNMLESIAPFSPTVIVYMGMELLGDLVKKFKRYFSGHTPVAIVCHAGFEGKEKIIRGCLDNICDKLGSNKDFMCLIYIGRAVVGKPFTTFQEGLSIYLRRNKFFDE
ncbi:MAG: SAM-dependent methyltransferase [Thermodesulfobacteriota bacterium]|nr:SAM-dependent methyltransferase [Thermodesulfobacteriota bacterium]